MKPKQLELARLYHFTSLSSEEIGEVMNVSSSAATGAAHKIKPDYFYQNEIDPRKSIDWKQEEKRKFTPIRIHRPFQETTTGMEFTTLEDAAEQLNLKPNTISRVLYGDINHTKGYLFKFI